MSKLSAMKTTPPPDSLGELQRLERQALKEGRDWTRRMLQQRLQEEVDRLGPVSPHSGRTEVRWCEAGSGAACKAARVGPTNAPAPLGASGARGMSGGVVREPGGRRRAAPRGERGPRGFPSRAGQAAAPLPPAVCPLWRIPA
jgi:hypothetical protein